MNAAEELAREIRRVTEIKVRFEAIAADPPAGVAMTTAPQIAAVEGLLERACRAAGSGEAIDVLTSLHELKEVN